jgi:hypothetical protein
MDILRKRTRKSMRPKDSKKEATIRNLIEKLNEHGHSVRREELKRGLGWRVQSGICRADKDRLIFVDTRLTQDDQIEFLQSTILKLKQNNKVVVKTTTHVNHLHNSKGVNNF